MKEKGRLLIKGIILGAIVGLLIFKFAVPKADGPAEITNQAALPQEVMQPNQPSAQPKTGEAVRVQEKTEAPKSEGAQTKSTGNAPDASQPEQKQQAAQGQQEFLPVWLLFRSTTCVPCIEMQKTMDALQAEFKGKVNFVPVDVNDPANEDLLVQFQIRYIPTSYLYDRNKKLNFQYVGALSVEDMRSKLQALVEVK